jgi:hypothetical protein
LLLLVCGDVVGGGEKFALEIDRILTDFGKVNGVDVICGSQSD